MNPGKDETRVCGYIQLSMNVLQVPVLTVIKISLPETWQFSEISWIIFRRLFLDINIDTREKTKKKIAS